MNINRQNIDQGWAWVVLASSFLTLFLGGWLLYGAGIMHVAFLEFYGESDTYTSFVGSLFTSLLSLVGPLASVFINTFNCRTTMIIGGILVFIGFSGSFFAQTLDIVLIFYGIIAGIGIGFTATPPLVSIGYYFEKKRGFAIGIAVAGAGIGMFASGPLFQYIIDTYGVHGAMLILGAVGANMVVFGCLMKPSEIEIYHKLCRKQEKDQYKHDKIWLDCQKICHLDIFCDKTFLLILAQYFMWNIPFSMIMLHLPNFSVINGSSEHQAAFLILLVGLTGTFGRLLTGMALGPSGIDPVLLNMGINGITGLITLLFPLYSVTYPGQCLFACFYGFYSGCLTCMIMPLSVELLGLEKMSTAIGIMYFIGGIGYILGPTMAGILIDNGGRYETTFLISGSLLIVAALLTLLSTIWRKDHTKLIDTDLEIRHSLKNSTFISQSGLLAGSIIIKVDSHLSLNNTPNLKRRCDNSGTYESQYSLFRNVILRDIRKNSDCSVSHSQTSLYQDSYSFTEIPSETPMKTTHTVGNPQASSLKTLHNLADNNGFISPSNHVGSYTLDISYSKDNTECQNPLLSN